MALKVVTWVQGTLRMVEGGPKKGRVYSVPSPAHNLDDLKAQLPALLQQGSRSNRDVLLVTDSPLLLPSVEEIPPAEIKLAMKLLSKRVEKAKLISEPFSIGVEPIHPPGEKVKGPARRYLVTASGLAWMQETDKVLMRAGLRFVGLLPLAAALRPLLRLTQKPPGDLLLLVVTIDGALYQVVGRSDGTIMFYRSMTISPDASAEGLQREIRRTLLFVEQKLNQRIGSVILAGDAGVLAKGFNLGEGVEVETGMAGTEATAAAAGLLRFRPASPENILPRELAMRERVRQIRMLLNLALAGTIAFTIAWMAGKSIQHQALIAQCLREEGIRRQDQLRLEQLATELRAYFRDTDGVRVVEEETGVPVAEIILRTLPEYLPPGLVLTRCEIRLDESMAGGSPPEPLYLVRLEGRTRQPNEAVLPLVKQLGANLEKMPWNVAVDAASGTARTGPEIAAELKEPGKFYFYGRTR